MLSNEERKEMLVDAKSAQRRRHFQAAANGNEESKISVDDYMDFLNSIQEIFSPFDIPRHSTPTKNNKL